MSVREEPAQIHGVGVPFLEDDARALLPAIVESAPIAMLVVDRAGRILFVNQGTQTLFGYAHDELLGNQLELLVPVQSRAKHREQCHSFFAAASARPMAVGRDLHALRKDGIRIPVEVALKPVRLCRRDAVLRETAKLMRHECRTIDAVARYGGEEFALTLPGSDLAAAITACERIRRAFERFDWNTHAPGMRVTISAGVSVWIEGSSVSDLLAKADAQLHEAKRDGRNRVMPIVAD